MNELYIIQPNKNISKILQNMVERSTKDIPHQIIDDINNIPDLTYKKLIFVAQVEDVGYDIPMIQFLAKLLERGRDSLKGSTGALMIYSIDDHGTKRIAQDIVYITNNIGCAFIGHPLVEATASLKNFSTWQKTMHMPLEEICYALCNGLVKRLMVDNSLKISNGKMLVLYSSTHKTSNTLDLWHMVSKHLSGISIKEIKIENGKVLDCLGCSYKLCLHYGKKKGCFYGGVITDAVMPSIDESDVIVWLCPNYNDAVAANLTAVINRLTALYRRSSFYKKYMFAVIVSGNSGSDSVAKQLIGALNINKGFRLPPYFSIRAIANDPKTIFNVDDIDSKTLNFSQNILNNFILKD
ncbi:MAG: NAD(P)H-dependent oxidoreductase [Clostridium sp.]|nr:NAD(P)H-dependent oxidoreductase [Clostridium sp.]MDU7082192.1 NAD(P)H-dependent oxidoreductase [Clostridium sp.]